MNLGDRIHHWATNAIFALIVIFNHKLGLELSVGDFCVLGAVLGLSQLQMILHVLRNEPSDKPEVEVKVDAPNS